jgi:putative ABC transport system substrate-binding protein
MKQTLIGFALCAMLFALCPHVQAQHPAGKVPGIGVLNAGASSSIPARLGAFRQGLRDLGYVEGQNIVIERPYAEGKLDRLSDVAAELVRLKVEVIVTMGTTGALAAQKATSTIPFVMTTGADPVAMGLIASLARPGGNIAGLTSVSTDLAGKRLELLKETVPRLTRVGILWNPADPGSTAVFKETETVARSLGVQVQSLEVRSPNDFESAFKAAIGGRAHALIIVQTALINNRRARIVELATKNRLPTMFGEGAHVESGGLMSYAPNSADLFRRAATYVDKILKGTKPADLPVEQPIKFDFMINLKTAKQIGLTIPPNVLVRADKVIR